MSGIEPLTLLQPAGVSGTVPYLGTFLTDLQMVDTANPDTTPSGLINVDKKRKEFEILAQIRLLQGAASLYRLEADPAFFDWFHSIRIYDDSESHDLSCEIEPEVLTTPPKSLGHRRKARPSSELLLDLIADSLGFFAPRGGGGDSPRSVSMTTTSPPEPRGGSPRSCRQSPVTGHRPPTLRHSLSAGHMTEVVDASPWKSPESAVVKVFLETSRNHDDTTHYKSILLTNSDHTKTVLSNILLKFDVSGSPDEFCIAQILPDRELAIPEKGNVFYAIDTNVEDIMFVVRRRSEKLKHKRGRKDSKMTL